MSYRVLRTLVVCTGRRIMTDRLGATGEPITRPETEELPPGSIIGGEGIEPGEVADLLARGAIEPVGEQQ